MIDLGPQPDPDVLLDPAGHEDAPVASVRAWICSECGLVQLVGPRPAGPRMPHGHGATALSSLLADPIIQDMFRLLPVDHRLVVEMDESDARTAVQPRFRTLPIDVATPVSLYAPGQQAGLVLAGHAFTHADDLDGLMSAIESVLAPGGVIAIEFHHVLGLAQGQFDVLSHAHRSYLSLLSLERLLDRYACAAIAAERLPEYGGTVRVLVGRRSGGDALIGRSSGMETIRQTERQANVQLGEGYEAVPRHVIQARTDLRSFLEEARRKGRMVAAYGAASRGTVLLNVAGIGPIDLPYVVDRSPEKQGRLLPGCRIPVLAPDEIERSRPDDILILPWPLASEIQEQLGGARARGARFTVAMPRLETLV